MTVVDKGKATSSHQLYFSTIEVCCHWRPPPLTTSYFPPDGTIIFHLTSHPGQLTCNQLTAVTGNSPAYSRELHLRHRQAHGCLKTNHCWIELRTGPAALAWSARDGATHKTPTQICSSYNQCICPEQKRR
ncbi:uncharacterized protein LOC130361405 isoform X2 [Hyla sarda]|uniref:uncharacterized protein LOC130361405 isoform X2 n=1 Tax=Hyla sarda TaxID=327740 RepID=UPI0024C2169B|nr:uncharacterized protein LOC130361405 isoform X2 [Hyla sarda]